MSSLRGRAPQTPQITSLQQTDTNCPFQLNYHVSGKLMLGDITSHYLSRCSLHPGLVPLGWQLNRARSSGCNIRAARRQRYSSGQWLRAPCQSGTGLVLACVTMLTSSSKTCHGACGLRNPAVGARLLVTATTQHSKYLYQQDNTYVINTDIYYVLLKIAETGTVHFEIA